MSCFNEDEIIREKQTIIDGLVTWLFEHHTESECVEAMREVGIEEIDIENYCR